MNKQEQLDVATLLVRLIQIDKETSTEHWLWDRIREYDFPHLKKYITDQEILAMEIL